ncbi:MAG: helix-hairpin-helix domain-containing protein [Bacteroidales bacterium]|nr:helix-hairpin-helix domain-containing protein [Bacteroidales bacterium]
MKDNGERKPGMAQSFVTGVIALVFLLVGYQTAMFIHEAAVMKVASNRDVPDTVYVYRAVPESMSGDVERSSITDSVVRKNASHGKHAEKVRHEMPYPRTESFAFNPNTVSLEDLQRLGFSRKQAQSIDNYRQKGGVFRRKSDFAKSYVVADSVYKRLEPYISIPLIDLNQADSAEFDSLPGIGGWFASKIIEHRERLGGYSYKEQLMDIYRFDQEKFDALSDLVTVSEPYRYPLWTLPVDSLRLHPYIRNYETAHAIVLFRQNSDPRAWAVDSLASCGIISLETASKLSRCVD